MSVKRAAELKPGDTVLLGPNNRRVVEAIEFIDNFQYPVRVRWVGREHTNRLAADKELTIEGEGP